MSEARLHYSRTKTGERRLKAVKVRLCDWLYRAILRDRQVLDYAAAYFQLGPIERRIYEVARSTCEDGPGEGEHAPIEIDLATFRLQIGYQNPLWNFCAAIKQIAGNDTIPDYDIALIETWADAPVPSRPVGTRTQGQPVAGRHRPAPRCRIGLRIGPRIGRTRVPKRHPLRASSYSKVRNGNTSDVGFLPRQAVSWPMGPRANIAERGC